MGKEKIAIACQGGGSQTAFTAGVLTAFFKSATHEEKEIVGLSGTSGGAVCAALAWYGLLQAADGDATPVEDRLGLFWRDNATKNPMENYLNDILIQYLQLVDGGLLPHWKSSPYVPLNQFVTSTLAWLMPQFYDFKGLLEKHIDFEALPRLMAPSKSPVLLLGAADVLSGQFKTFNSLKDGIQAEMILASAAVPWLFRAVTVHDRAYWDGLFSDNPPTDELVDREAVGDNRVPNQIWVIQINPTSRTALPTSAEAITDRRNEMIGNESLYHDLNRIRLINKLIGRKAFRPEYLKDHHLEPIRIYIIEMSRGLQEKLDYTSKLNRNEEFIEHLLADGKRQGRAFLQDQESMRYDDQVR
jgi:NTE family protein